MKLTRRELGVMGIAGVAVSRTTWAAGPLADMPAGAIDCHNHIIGPIAKYPMAANRTYTPPEASVAQLKALRAELGIARNVIVQPSFYGCDNSCLVDALTDLGTSARGIAVVQQNVSDAELQRLASKGVTGVRLNLSTVGVRDPKVAIDAINAFAPRLVPMGWHIQINAKPELIVEIEPLLMRLPTPLVFDHLAHVPRDVGVESPAFETMRKLIDQGRTWVKLSGAG